MMASKGPPDVSVGREVRSVVEAPRRSPAEEPEPAWADWTWEAEKSLEGRSISAAGPIGLDNVFAHTFRAGSMRPKRDPWVGEGARA